METLEQLKKMLNQADQILLTGPENPNVDVLSTAAAWAIFLLSKNKKVNLVFSGHLPRVDFLPANLDFEDKLEAFGKFKILVDLKKTKIKQLSYDVKDDILAIDLLPEGGFLNPADIKSFSEDYRYDLIISFGAQNLQSLGATFAQAREFFHQKPIINIDRQVANENFGQLNIVETTATSLAEVSHQFLQKNLNPEIATALLAGMISATNSFQSAQVTPQTLDLASALIISGADRAKVIEVLYRTKNIDVLKVWGKVLSRISKKGNIISSYLEHQEVENLPDDFQELVRDLILSTPQSQVAVIFYQLDFESTEVWLYSKNNIDALALVKNWSGEGSRQFAKFSIAKQIDLAQEEVLEHLQAKLKLINNPD
ncbi:hypothetical protein H6761_02755 [Candidatus Nomurabacteria bacterium]|nr:hypothetical protein [Candidatus Nomurabacteria bacterium]